MHTQTHAAPIRLVKIFPELRAAQVERQAAMCEATCWCFARNYDLIGEHLPAEFTFMNTPAALWALVRGVVCNLEVPELLWARELPRTLALLVCFRIGRALHRGHGSASFYAIENNRPASALLGSRAEIPLVRSAILLVLGLICFATVDRIAFGSAGAQESYHAVPFVKRIPSMLFEELPAPAPPNRCRSSDVGAVFVGALEARKGVPELMAAWKQAEKRMAGSTLTIIGAGPLADAVESWAAGSARRRYLGALPHHLVEAEYRRNAVLVAPSQREGRWREQIGLPIKEGLERGLNIVTTAETGLAEWLRSNGHTVIDRGSAAELARALITALDRPLPAATVVAALPTQDGRLAADRWLHGGLDAAQ